MANQANQKLKTLVILKLLMEKTDDEHSIGMADLIAELDSVGIKTERKSVYRDMKVLTEMGFQIKMRGKNREYYLANRPFTIEQLTMLVDTVLSSQFLNEEMTEAMVASISAFASDFQKKALERRIEVSDRARMENASVFETMNVIQEALRVRRKVAFQYVAYDTKMQLVEKWGGVLQKCTPLTLFYAEEHYYLIAYNPARADIGPYRVDRIVNAQVTEEPFDVNEKITNYDPKQAFNVAFGIYKAPVETIKLQVKNDSSFMNTIVDKFGVDVKVYSEKGSDFVTVVDQVALTPQFFGWLLQVHQGVKLVHPTKAVKAYKSFLQGALAEYDAPSE